MSSAPPQPTVLLTLEGIVHNAHLFNALHTHANVFTVKSKAEALSFLAAHTPHAVLLTDAALSTDAYRDLCERLHSYVLSGGIAVMCNEFSSFLKTPVFNRWM